MKRFRLSIYSIIIGLVALTFMGLIHFKQIEYAGERTRTQFIMAAEDAYHRIDKNFRVYAGLLGGVKYFFAASQEVSADEFEVYASQALRENGVLAACYVSNNGSKYASPAGSLKLCDDHFISSDISYDKDYQLFTFGTQVQSASGESGRVNIIFREAVVTSDIQKDSGMIVSLLPRADDVLFLDSQFKVIKDTLPALDKVEQDFKLILSGNRAKFYQDLSWQHYALLGMILFLAIIGINSFEYIYRNKEIIQGRLDLQEESLKKQFEETLHHKKIAHHQSKLASMGVLAAGVGHEINNPLVIIKGYISTIMNKTNDRFLIETLQKIDTAADRIAGITTGLRTFSRTDDDEITLFDPVEATEESLNLVQGIYSTDGVRISLTHDKSCLNKAIKGSRGRFQQVLMNLISNARDAVEDSKTKNIQINLTSTDSDYTICIADSGHGISEEHREQILDPFFTTKDVKKGTGIGLSLVNSFVGEMNGQLVIDSTPGHGSEFKILLPFEIVSEESKLETDIKLSADAESFEMPAKKVLLVDDEEIIREILISMLEELGLEVVEAADGHKALELLKDDKNQFSLVISDMKMPTMNGPDLLKNLREDSSINNQPKFIFITGGVNVNLDEDFEDYKHDGYIYKPFNQADLSKAIKKALESD